MHAIMCALPGYESSFQVESKCSGQKAGGRVGMKFAFFNTTGYAQTALRYLPLLYLPTEFSVEWSRNAYRSEQRLTERAGKGVMFNVHPNQESPSL